MCEELVPISLTYEELVPFSLTFEELVPIPLICEERERERSRLIIQINRLSPVCMHAVKSAPSSFTS